MAKYRKKPVVIDAIQFDGTAEGLGLVIDFTKELVNNGDREDDGSVTFGIPTLGGVMKVSVGDWIIKGVAGEFYPCKPHIFAATYELAELRLVPDLGD